jgi:hypothetical protein
MLVKYHDQVCKVINIRTIKDDGDKDVVQLKATFYLVLIK